MPKWETCQWAYVAFVRNLLTMPTRGFANLATVLFVGVHAAGGVLLVTGAIYAMTRLSLTMKVTKFLLTLHFTYNK